MNTLTDSGRHPVNIGHLVMGVAFAGLVVIWAIVQSDVVEDDEIRWLLPAPWVLAGAIGLVAATLASRRRTQPTFAEPSHSEPAAPAESTTTTDTEELR